MGFLTGGSKSSSQSYNKAYDTLNSSFSPLLGYANTGASGLASLLSGDTTGLDKYKSAMGYDWTLGQGLASTAANRANKGLSDSGATLKALANYQTGLNNQYNQNYMTGLTGLSQLGLSAGQALAGAGNVSNSSQSSNPGLGGLIGSIGGAIATGGMSSLLGGLGGGLASTAARLAPSAAATIAANPSIF